ncbi:MAG: hypothetical protein JNL21_27845 [Myxococcales bacterium]|nr:hypothetical protein [Myxococcales bacterium]
MTQSSSALAGPASGLAPAASPSSVVGSTSASASASASASPSASGTAPGPSVSPDSISFAIVPFAKPDPGPAGPGGFTADASRCLTDPSCSMERYASLLLASVDAGESPADGSCFQLLRGVGVPPDIGRAGACFEKAVAAEGECGGSSPSIDRMQLALHYALGRGRPRSSETARKTLLGCFEDGSVGALDEVITSFAQGRGHDLSSLDVCEAGLAATTLAMSMCVAEDRLLATIRDAALEKALLARYDRAFLAAFKKAGAEHAAYADAMLLAAADVYRGGTMSTVTAPSARNHVVRNRTVRWEILLRRGVPPLPDPKEAREKLLAERDAAPKRAQADLAWRNLVRDTEKAYAPFRAHEAELLTGAPKLDASQAQAWLDVDRTDELSLLDAP